MSAYLVDFVTILVWVLYIAILARVIISWIPIGPDSPFAPIFRMIYQITEPFLAPIRGLLPSMGTFDLSPMIALILLMVIQNIVFRFL